jgi:hypothetical protein
VYIAGGGLHAALCPRWQSNRLQGVWSYLTTNRRGFDVVASGIRSVATGRGSMSALLPMHPSKAHTQLIRMLLVVYTPGKLGSGLCQLQQQAGCSALCT